jgi:hypothetical protein
MRTLVPALLLLFLSACDTTTESVHEPEPVVEAYLVAGRELPRVRLTMTAAIGGTFDADARGIAGAAVRIDQVAPDGSADWSAGYVPLDGSPGVYVPLEGRVVNAGATYRLDVELADGSRVGAVTVVPAAFELVDRNADAVVYQGSEQFEIELTPSSYPGRAPIYVIAIEAMEPSPGRLTPLYLDAIYELDADDAFDPDTLDPAELSDFLVVSSPPLNEANYRDEGDPTVKAQLPWFSVVFYGPTRILVHAIDDNLYDFMRFQAAQRGGSTLSPGEIPNIRDPIEGGVGVFGSYATVEAVVDILEP